MPLGKRRGAALFEGLPINDVAFEIEVIANIGVDRSELLQRLHSSEPAHCALSSAERQVAVCRAVVSVPANLLPVGIAELVHRCPVGCNRCSQATAVQGMSSPTLLA